MPKEEGFYALRPLLFSIAYKMTGTVQDSEDILQDVLVKWLQVAQPVSSQKAYLAKAVANTCINFIKRKQQEREKYFGLWLPEPVPTEEPELLPQEDEELQYGFLLLLENLSPLERAVYLLRESFGLSYKELAENFELQEDHCRQLYHRAKARLHKRKRFEVESQQKHKMLMLFEEACTTGNLSLLIGQLKEDIVLYSDGGGKVPAAVNNIHGKTNASKFLQGIYSKNGVRATFRFVYLNNSPAAVVFINGGPDTVAVLEADESGISHMYFVRNPEKIQHLQKFL
ncbi:sigma-70 family RNA polymerase sigma factor [Pontibacter sp. 13R65]|uniref:sigma-70 family RNA polymerase sigma factor n=1 Tax=Pontibacter sp. 13R65 TaxID=3127458 RepID=UPI00301D0D11